MNTGINEECPSCSSIGAISGSAADPTPGLSHWPIQIKLIGCPKLDDATYYVGKFTEIFSNIPIKKVSCLRMEVPCCGGMTAVLKEAITRSDKAIPFTEMIVGVKGDVLGERQVLG